VPAFRDIMVVLDDTVRSEIRLAAAIQLAQFHDAHLIGVSALSLLCRPKPVRFALGYSELPLSPSHFLSRTDPAMAGRSDEAASVGERSERLEAQFRRLLRSHGLRGDWRLANGKLIEAFVCTARHADLVIVGQNDPTHPYRRADRQLVHDILMGAGRPILVIPYAGKFASVGTRVLIGWNGSRVAARAVNDALPLLAAATSVTILEAYSMGGMPTNRDANVDNLRTHLAHHGIEAETSRTVMAGISPTDALLSYATDISADLLVVGGQGHSSARNFMFGGVTRGLLNEMTLPVLMSH